MLSTNSYRYLCARFPLSSHLLIGPKYYINLIIQKKVLYSQNYVTIYAEKKKISQTRRE